LIDIDNKETNGNVTYNVGDICIDIPNSHGVIVAITARIGQKNPLPCFMIFINEDIARSSWLIQQMETWWTNN
jgi:hypothetical protein